MITYLDKDSYFSNNKGELWFFEKGTESTLYAGLKRLYDDDQEMIAFNFKERKNNLLWALKYDKSKKMKADIIFKGNYFQTDTLSLQALITAKESGNDPIKWYDSENKGVLLTHDEISELITKISTRNGKITKDNQIMKESLNLCKDMQELKDWEAKYGIN